MRSIARSLVRPGLVVLALITLVIALASSGVGWAESVVVGAGNLRRLVIDGAPQSQVTELDITTGGGAAVTLSGRRATLAFTGGGGTVTAGAGLTQTGTTLDVGAGTCTTVGADSVGLNLDCAPTWTAVHTHAARVLFPSGTNAAPAVSFSADPDSGFVHSAGSGITQVGVVVDAQTIIMCSTLDCTFGPRIMIANTGNATAPSVTWSADGNTGFFNNSNDAIGVTAGGTERARWTTTGLGLGVVPTAPFSLKSHTAFANSERNMRTHGVRTTDATQTHSTIVTMTVDATRCWLQANIQADGTTNTSHGTYQVNASVRRNAGAVSVVGATTTTYFESDAAMDVTVTASGNDVRLSLTGLGAGDSTIDWAASSAWQCVTSST